MQYDSKQNLAFLLSMVALPMAGCVITSGDDDDDTGDSGNASNSNSNSDDGTTSGDDTTGGASLDETGSDSIGDTGSTGAVDGTGTTGGDTPAVCSEVGAHFDKCTITKPSPDEIIQECVYYVTYPANTPACTTANEDYYACLAMADCDALTMGKVNPCQAEQDAIFAACGEEGTTGGGAESSTGG